MEIKNLISASISVLCLITVAIITSDYSTDHKTENTESSNISSHPTHGKEENSSRAYNNDKNIATSKNSDKSEGFQSPTAEKTSQASASKSTQTQEPDKPETSTQAPLANDVAIPERPAVYIGPQNLLDSSHYGINVTDEFIEATAMEMAEDIGIGNPWGEINAQQACYFVLNYAYFGCDSGTGYQFIFENNYNTHPVAIVANGGSPIDLSQLSPNGRSASFIKYERQVQMERGTYNALVDQYNYNR